MLGPQTGTTTILHARAAPDRCRGQARSAAGSVAAQQDTVQWGVLAAGAWGTSGEGHAGSGWCQASARENGAMSPVSHPLPRQGALCQGGQRSAADYVRKQKKTIFHAKTYPLSAAEVCGGRGAPGPPSPEDTQLRPCNRWGGHLVLAGEWGGSKGKAEVGDFPLFWTPPRGGHGCQHCYLWLPLRPVRSERSGCPGAPRMGCNIQRKQNYGTVKKAGFGNPSGAGGEQGTNAALCPDWVSRGAASASGLLSTLCPRSCAALAEDTSLHRFPGDFLVLGSLGWAEGNNY